MELLNILRVLYGNNIVEDIVEHKELLEEIERLYDYDYDYDYNLIEYPSEEDMWKEHEAILSVTQEQYEKDYDKALEELNEELPSDRELCLLRLAREAARKEVGFCILNDFVREYKLTCEEQVAFYNEYYTHIYD